MMKSERFPEGGEVRGEQGGAILLVVQMVIQANGRGSTEGRGGEREGKGRGERRGGQGERGGEGGLCMNGTWYLLRYLNS